MASSLSSLCFIACVVATLSCMAFELRAAADPTSGFTAVSLNEGNFQLQKAYDKARDQRYSFDGTVRKLWVFENDKPYSPTSNTKPRTEMEMTGYDYSSGVWQFEGDAFVPSGTSGVSIMQVFGAVGHSTTLMLHVNNGVLQYYDQRDVEGNIYNRWFHLNVVHDVGASKLTVYINGQKKLQVAGRGGNSHYFKFGVYTQKNPSHRMESHWKNVRILKKN